MRRTRWTAAGAARSTLLAAVLLAVGGMPAAQASIRSKLRDARAANRELRHVIRVLEHENRDLRLDIDRLSSGLPQAILAAPLDRFRELVLEPARERWVCDHLYEGENGWWSFTFDVERGCP